MIITLSGNIASGKSTVAEALSQKLGMKHYSTGEFMRQMAKQEGVSLQELGKKAEKDFSIDKKIDDWTINLGKSEDNFIIDSRLAWHFIPDSIKIYLFVGKKDQMRRLMLDQKLKRRKAEDFKNENDAVKKIIARENSEDKRYKKYYKLNYHDKKHYDLWLNTDGMTIDYCAEVLRKFIEEKYGYKGAETKGFVSKVLKFILRK